MSEIDELFQSSIRDIVPENEGERLVRMVEDQHLQISEEEKLRVEEENKLKLDVVSLKSRLNKLKIRNPRQRELNTKIHAERDRIRKEIAVKEMKLEEIKIERNPEQKKEEEKEKPGQRRLPAKQELAKSLFGHK